jgi:hypothetical protein
MEGSREIPGISHSLPSDHQQPLRFAHYGILGRLPSGNISASESRSKQGRANENCADSQALSPRDRFHTSAAFSISSLIVHTWSTAAMVVLIQVLLNTRLHINEQFV